MPSASALPSAVSLVHERLVDLDAVDGEPLQVSQGRVAGAEVVDGQLQPKRLELSEPPNGAGYVAKAAGGPAQRPQRSQNRPHEMDASGEGEHEPSEDTSDDGGDCPTLNLLGVLVLLDDVDLRELLGRAQVAYGCLGVALACHHPRH